MKALVQDGLVREVVENEFPVHPSLQWVDCDVSIKPGHTWDGSSFAPPVPEPQAPEPPVSDKEMLEALWDKANGDDTKFNAAKAKKEA